MSKKDLNYRQLSAELDEILQNLESADLDIDEALKKYQRGMEIVQQLEDYLKTAENKVTKIKSEWKKVQKITEQ